MICGDKCVTNHTAQPISVQAQRVRGIGCKLVGKAMAQPLLPVLLPARTLERSEGREACSAWQSGPDSFLKVFLQIEQKFRNYGCKMGPGVL